MSWLAEIPLCVVRAHLEMLPRLEADEALGRANSTAVGAGLQPGDWIKDQLRTWDREANGGRRRLAPKATTGDLRAIGIGVKVVKVG